VQRIHVLARLAPLAVRLLDRPRRTELGMILATPNFAPREQLLGQLHRIGPATDVWALAALFVFLVTGGTVPDPFAPALVSARLPGLPRSLRRVLDAALSPDETKRPSAAELAAALHSPSAA